MALSTGTRLGPYEILAPLGAGGMGEVYRARDTRLGREVAVKVLPADVADDACALARFEGEARAVAALSHPNILDLHDVGKEDGISYVVTELLQGETLRELLCRGPLSPQMAFDFGLQVARGLAAAHEKGVIHRDVKPENLFVTSDGGIKILDFGLAKRTELGKRDDVTSAPTASKRTEPGLVVGTLGYMSPEQVKGIAVDHRSDVFSFGAVLYEMLSGRRAFKRDTAAETTAAILRDQPPSLPDSGVGIAPALNRLVERCLEKSVEQRFQSARDIVFALLEAAESAGSGAAHVVPQSIRLPRNPVVFVASGLVALLAVVGLLVLRRNSPAPSQPMVAGPSIAVLPFENLSGDAEQEYFSDGLAEELTGLLTKIQGLHVAGRTSSFTFKRKNERLPDIGRELHVAAVLTGSVRRAGDRLRVSTRLVKVSDGYQIWAETYDRKMGDVFSVQDEIAMAVVAALKVQLLPHDRPQSSDRRTSNPDAYNQYLLGRHFFDRGNSENYRRSIEAYSKAIALDPGFASAYAGLAISEAMAADVSAVTAPDLAQGRQRALGAATTALSLDPNLAEGYAARGFLRCTTTWDWTGAQADLERALSLHPGDASNHILYGDLLARLGRLPEAIKEARSAVDLDPLSADAWTALGFYLRALGQLQEAREALQRAIAIVPDADLAQSTLGSISLLEGHPQAALQEFRRSGIREGTRLMGEALAEHDLGSSKASEQALKILIAKYADTWALQIADVYAWRGQPDPAFNWLDRAYSQRDAGLPYIKLEPYLVKLRDDPRYGSLLKKLGLPAATSRQPPG